MEQLLTTLAQVSPNNLPTLSFDATLPNVIRVAFAGIALLSVIFVIIGGFKYVVSNGDPKGIASAKDTIVAAVIGLVIAVLAFTIVGFVAGKLQ